MRQAGVVGIHRRRRGGCTRRDPAGVACEDLVNRAFDPTEADRLWVMDVTEHPTGDGKAYLAVVLDAFSRRVVGWSIAGHIRSELVVDALRWPCGGVDRPPARRWPTRTTDRNTPRGHSVAGCGAPAFSAPWAASGTASTTRWPRASSAPSRWSCSTSTTGRAGSSWRWPSSSGSSAGHDMRVIHLLADGAGQAVVTTAIGDFCGIHAVLGPRPGSCRR